MELMLLLRLHGHRLREVGQLVEDGIELLVSGHAVKEGPNARDGDGNAGYTRRSAAM